MLPFLSSQTVARSVLVSSLPPLPPPKLQTTQSLTPFQAGIYMYEKGAYDVDCGKFEYKISKSNEPPIQEVADFIEYNRYCYKPEEPPPAQRGCQQPSNYDEHTMAL